MNIDFRARRRRFAALGALLLLLLLAIAVVWLIRREAPLEGSLLLSVEQNAARRWLMLDIASGATHDWNLDVSPSIPAGSTDMQISPDRTLIAFSVFDAPSDTMRIYVVGSDGSNLRPLTKGEGRDHSATWSPDSTQIVFSRSRGFRSALFVVGVETGVENQITDFTNDLQADRSPDGSRIVFTTSRDGFQELYTYTFATGEFQRLTHNDLQNDLHARFSPDGRSIAYMSNYAVGDGSGEIWLMDADGGNQRRLTNDQQDDYHPRWSPDGSAVVFGKTALDRNGGDLWLYDVSSGQMQQLTESPGHELEAIWSPDGCCIAYIHDQGGSRRALSLIRLADRQPHILFSEPDIRVWFVSAWLPAGLGSDSLQNLR